MSPSRTSGNKARLAVVIVGTMAVSVGVIWLAYTFLRFGPLDIASSLWGDYFAWGLDYRSYYDAAGRIVGAGSPYAPALLSAPFESGPSGLYYYSPFLAVSLLPIVDISFVDSSVWWFIAQVVALAGACVLMPVRPLTRCLAFAIVAIGLPVFKDVIYGNVSTVLLLPTVMAWRWMDRPLGSIALALSISIRPTLGLLLVWQLIRRRWRVAAWTIGAGMVIIMVTLPIVGFDGYLDYIKVLGNLHPPTGDLPGTYGRENHDFGQVARSVGASVDVMGLVRLGSVAFAIGAMLLSLRRDRDVSFMVTLVATLLVVPLLWDHHLTLLVIPAAFLAERWRPAAVALPLLAWFPSVAAFVVVFTMVLLFLVRDADAPEGSSPAGPSGRPRLQWLPHQTGSV